MSNENQDPRLSSITSAILWWVPDIKWLRRLIVGVIGFTVLLIGVVMIILPGPAFLVIPLGLAILATEFVWAQRLLKKAKDYFEKQRKRVSNKVRGKRAE